MMLRRGGTPEDRMRNLRPPLASWLLAPALALALAAGPAAAQQKKEESLEETARSAIEALMDVMRTLVDKIPMYEAPVILENGDILIRRKRAEPDPAPQPKPQEGPTRT
jgi:hypothetical protein